jgi:hypothetical protein
MSARAAPARIERALPQRKAAVPDVVRRVVGMSGAPLSRSLQASFAEGPELDFSAIPARSRAAPATVAERDHPDEPWADRLAERLTAQHRSGASASPLSAALERVRVHTDALAAQAARAIGAQAFAADGHLVFGAGAWRPETADGRALIAHELAHAARPGPPGTVWRKALPNGEGDADQVTPTDLADVQKDANKPDQAAAPEPRPTAAPAPGAAPAAAAAPGADATAPAKGAATPKPAPGTSPPSGQQDAKAVADFGVGDLALIDEELAEHERWGAAAAVVGQAESAQRAAFVAKEAGGGAGKGAVEGAKEGVTSTIKMKLAEKVVEKVAIATAVKLGAKAGAFKAVPGVGSVIGGAIAAYALAERDWGKTGDAIAGFGKGADIYEQLANTIESISTVLEVATQVANVIAGILGVIVVVSWIAAVASGGALGPLATLLSSIAIKIGLVSMVIDAINALVLKPLITTFRSLHAFASDADPRDVVAQGAAIEQAAGGATGFVSGFAAGAALDKGVHMAGKKMAARLPDHPGPPAKSGEGPHVKAEPPPHETAKSASGETPTPAAAPEPAASAPEPAAAGPAAEPGKTAEPIAAPAAPEAPAPPAAAPAEPPQGATARSAEAAPPAAAAPPEGSAHEAPTPEPGKPAAQPAAAPEAGPVATAAEPQPAAAPEAQPAAAQPPAAEPPAAAAGPEPAAPASAPEPPGASRKQKGEAVWAATEQLGEKFDMDLGVSPGDRVRLENKAATRKAQLAKQMDAAGYKPVQGGKEVSTIKWEPKEGAKPNSKRAARAQEKYNREIAKIGAERQTLREQARKDFFAKETGATTLDVENWNPAADAKPGGPGPEAPITGPVKPDVELPLSEPKRATPGAPAEAGLLGRHEHQPPRGDQLISEHVGPGAQYGAISEGPGGRVYDERQYAMDKTLLVDKDVAQLKTHEGPNSDNRRTEALKQKAAGGGRVDVVQDIYLPSIEQTHWAMDQAAQRRNASGGPAPAATPPATPHAPAAAPAAAPSAAGVAPHPAAAPPGSPTATGHEVASPAAAPAVTEPVPPVDTPAASQPAETQAGKPASAAAALAPEAAFDTDTAPPPAAATAEAATPKEAAPASATPAASAPQADAGGPPSSGPPKPPENGGAGGGSGGGGAKPLFDPPLTDAEMNAAFGQASHGPMFKVPYAREQVVGGKPEMVESLQLSAGRAREGASPKELNENYWKPEDKGQPAQQLAPEGSPHQYWAQPGSKGMVVQQWTFKAREGVPRIIKGKEVPSGAPEHTALRIHSPDPTAPPGSVSGGSWTAGVTQRRNEVRMSRDGTFFRVDRGARGGKFAEVDLGKKRFKRSGAGWEDAAGKEVQDPHLIGELEANDRRKGESHIPLFPESKPAAPGGGPAPPAPSGGGAPPAEGPSAAAKAAEPGSGDPSPAPAPEPPKPAPPPAPQAEAPPPGPAAAPAAAAPDETAGATPATSPPKPPSVKMVAAPSPTAPAAKPVKPPPPAASAGQAELPPVAPQSKPVATPEASSGAAPPPLKSDAPITERVNPPYQPPPGTPDQIVSLRNQVVDTLAARAQQEEFAGLMSRQEQNHKANQKPLGDMKAKTDEAITATEAHKRAVAHRDEANQRKLDQEKEAEGKLTDYDTKAGELLALKLPLKGVQKFTGLAAALPDDPQGVLRFKNGMLKMSKDSSNFIAKLDQIDKTVADQKAGAGDRQVAAKADGNLLNQTKDKAGASKDSLTSAKDTTADVDTANTDRMDQAKSEKTAAQNAAGALDKQAKDKTQQADSLAAAMQAWANQHRKTRLDALAQTRKRLEAQGWRVTEAAE